MDGSRISLTPTVARQAPASSFGRTLKDALRVAGQLGGTLLNAVPGAGVVSAAVSHVTTLASAGWSTTPSSSAALAASAGVVSLGGPSGVTGATGATSHDAAGSVPADLSSMLQTMRDEANRSIAMQMSMQSESRAYNALSNVLKVRHDSAKAAINNLR